MKIPHQMLWSVVGGFALATGAYAGGGSGQAEVKMIDTDGDGAITAAEHEAGSKKMFEKMDKDHNGKLSAAEVQAGHERMMSAEDQ
jgi:EF hand domain-containing protein